MAAGCESGFRVLYLPVHPVLSPRAAAPFGTLIKAADSPHHDAELSCCRRGLPSASTDCGRAAVRSTTAVSRSGEGGAASGGSKLTSTKRNPCSVKDGSWVTPPIEAEEVRKESTGQAQNKFPIHVEPS